MKNMCLRNVNILEKFLKDSALNKKYITEKDDFEILRWPYLTFYNLLIILEDLLLKLLPLRAKKSKERQ